MVNMNDGVLCACLEPKIKYYFSVNTKLGSKNEFELKNIQLDNKLDKLTENFTKY